MSTLSVDFTNPAISFGGGFADYVNGSTRIRHIGDLAIFDFSFVGTAISINGLIPTGCTVSLDGGGATTIPNTSGGFSSAVLASGLADNGVVHTLHLNVPQAYLNVTGLFTITYGTNVGSVSNTTGFGPTYNLWEAAVLAAVDPEGQLELAGQASVYQQEVVSFTKANSQLRFRATCTGISLYTKCQGQKFALYTDGVRVAGTKTLPNDNSFAWVSMFTGLDASAEHEYRVMMVANNSIAYSTTYQVMVVGGSINTAVLAQKTVIKADGDSQIAGWSSDGDASSGLGQLIADANGWVLWNAGMNSKTVRQAIGDSSQSATVFDPFSGESAHVGLSSYASTDMLRCPRVRHRIVALMLLWMGTNDQKQLQGLCTTTEFTASFVNMIKKYLHENPGVGLLILPAGPRADISEGTRTTWNAAALAAVTSVNNPAVVWAANAFNGVTSGDTVGDGIHFTVAGVAKIYANITGYVAAATAITNAKAPGLTMATLLGMYSSKGD